MHSDPSNSTHTPDDGDWPAIGQSDVECRARSVRDGPALVSSSQTGVLLANMIAKLSPRTEIMPKFLLSSCL